MRTDVLSFILGSENRANVAKALFEYPKRQWSCSALEDVTRLPHTTVFRTLRSLRDFGILRATKINRKDIVYEVVVESPFTQKLRYGIGVEKEAAIEISKKLVKGISTKEA